MQLPLMDVHDRIVSPSKLDGFPPPHKFHVNRSFNSSNRLPLSENHHTLASPCSVFVERWRCDEYSRPKPSRQAFHGLARG